MMGLASIPKNESRHRLNIETNSTCVLCTPLKAMVSVHKIGLHYRSKLKMPQKILIYLT